MNSYLSLRQLLSPAKHFRKTLGYSHWSPLSAMSKPRPLLASQPSRHQHDQPRLQFPQLPPEWEGRFKKGQMHQYADKVMKLPVPPLQQTLQKYITSVEPLLTEEELAETKRKAEEFGKPGGIGEWLQEKLQERAKIKESWLAEWWSQVAYLAYRLPVPVHVTPAICYPPQPAGDPDTYLRTATSHLLCVVKWVLLIQHEAIPPDVYRKKPMCMSQYDMYQKVRIPLPGMDRSQQTPIHQARHVLVMRNGHFFKLDVLYEAPNGELSVAPASHLLEQLRIIMKTATDPAPYPVGILTSEHRDTWAEARERLAADPINVQSLKEVETAMFTLCLDKAHPHASDLQTSFRDTHATVLAKRCLHGNGTQHNTCNRWFDTAVQVMIGEDGGCGSNLEHSAGDGPAAIATNVFSMDILHSLKYDILSEVSPVEPAVLKPAQQLQWNISPDTARDIAIAKTNLDNLVQDTDIVSFTFADFGKNFSKAVKLSPDGFIQVAIQLAYYKLYGHPTATYESGATRWFKFGRTDTIRSTTNASTAFVRAMSEPNISVEEKANLLVKAITAHSKYTDDAISGQAVDRHLLGLKLTAAENNIETPDIFNDVAFSRSLHFCLSTSQVPVPNHRIFLCFGAVVEDGYGVCYNPRETEILFTVSSWHHCSETDSLLMASRLQSSLQEMRDVMVQAGRVAAKL